MIVLLDVPRARFVVFNIQRSFRHFFCNLIMENQKEKTVFEYYVVAASVSHLQARVLLDELSFLSHAL